MQRAAVLLIALLAGFAPSALAREPLLAPGKSALYQRVISHPGARLAAAPGADGGEVTVPFTPFYVYKRVLLDGKQWLELSVSSQAGENDTRWLPEAACSAWDKALTLTFADRMSRDPVMFFKTRAELEKLVTSSRLRDDADLLLYRHGKERTEDESPLLALEPQDAALPREAFYLIPIFECVMDYKQFNLRLLKVGCVNPGAGVAPEATPGPKADRFRAGLAFIVDTTISMRPYIEQTKVLVGQAFDALENTPVADDVGFALVAYRNSPRFDPRLEYVSRVVAPFTLAKERRTLEKRLELMDEAPVSTHAFNEDAFAGIKNAVDALDWSPYAVKIAVLVTDAGAIRNADPYSSTGLNEQEMGELLAQKGIRLVVIHMRTAAGKKHNLPEVEQQYKTLTALHDGDVKNAYIGMPVLDPAGAGRDFGRLAQALVDVVRKQLLLLAAGNEPQRPDAPDGDGADPRRRVERLASYLGYAARLEFVGQRDGVEAPAVREAWVADKDLASLSEGRPTDALTVTVLLNKRQLDALARQLQHLVDAARVTRSMDSARLFQQLSSLSAQTVRDPERLQRAGADANLAELGLMPEFLDGLPYLSRVMTLTENGWAAMNAREQDDFIHDMESKLNLYREYHNDVDNWADLGAGDPAERLYRVPLSSLP